MAPRGNKPKPTAIRKLEGNREKRPINQHEPQPLIGPEPPKPPAWLSDVARAEWERLSRQLWLNGILGLEDEVAFASYCESFADWMRYNDMMAAEETRLREGGAARRTLDAALGFGHVPDPKAATAGHVETVNGRPVVSPILALRNAARKDCIRYATEFGLSPSSRSRVNVPRGAVPTVVSPDATGPRPADFLNRGPRLAVSNP